MADEDENDAAEEAEDTAAEGEDGEDGEGEDGGGKSGKKKLLLIIVPLVLLLGGGAGAYFTGLLDSLLGTSAEQVCTEVDDGHGNMVEECHDVVPEGEDGEHGAAMDENGAQMPGHFISVPELIINLTSNDNQPRFLKISVELELEDEQDVAALEAVMPRIKDHFQTYLRELRVEDLRGSSGIYRLRLELLSRVNTAAPNVKVRDVLFQEILIQ